jgi:hypothetical protein
MTPEIKSIKTLVGAALPVQGGPGFTDCRHQVKPI